MDNKKPLLYWTQTCEDLAPSKEITQQEEENETIKIFNPLTQKNENIKLKDYLNSFGDYDTIIKPNNEKAQEILNEFMEKYTKNINIENIAQGEDEEQQQIKKLYNYIQELQAKQQGENKK